MLKFIVSTVIVNVTVRVDPKKRDDVRNTQSFNHFTSKHSALLNV